MYSYVGVPARSKPRFNNERAMELGVQPRRHFKDLIDNKNITLDSGEVISPDMVFYDALPPT